MPSTRYVAGMVKISCSCGAVYAVTTHAAPMGHTGVFRCTVCRREMDRWNEARVYEIYALVQSPQDDSAGK